MKDSAARIITVEGYSVQEKIAGQQVILSTFHGLWPVFVLYLSCAARYSFLHLFLSNASCKTSAFPHIPSIFQHKPLSLQPPVKPPLSLSTPHLVGASSLACSTLDGPIISLQFLTIVCPDSPSVMTIIWHGPLTIYLTSSSKYGCKKKNYYTQ